MKGFAITVAILNLLLLFSVTMCGFWIHAQKVADPSSVDFHMKLGVVTVIGGAVAAVLLIMLAGRK